MPLILAARYTTHKSPWHPGYYISFWMRFIVAFPLLHPTTQPSEVPNRIPPLPARSSVVETGRHAVADASVYFGLHQAEGAGSS